MKQVTIQNIITISMIKVQVPNRIIESLYFSCNFPKCPMRICQINQNYINIFYFTYTWISKFGYSSQMVCYNSPIYSLFSLCVKVSKYQEVCINPFYKIPNPISQQTIILLIIPLILNRSYVQRLSFNRSPSKIKKSLKLE